MIQNKHILTKIICCQYSYSLDNAFQAKQRLNIKITFMSVYIVTEEPTPLQNLILIQLMIIFVNHVRLERMNAMVILFYQMMVTGMKILIVIQSQNVSTTKIFALRWNNRIPKNVLQVMQGLCVNHAMNKEMNGENNIQKQII